MLLAALALVTASAQPALPPRVAAVEQARATVRIISGVRIDADRPPEEAIVRETRLRSPNGAQEHVSLIEFP